MKAIRYLTNTTAFRLILGIRGIFFATSIFLLPVTGHTGSGQVTAISWTRASTSLPSVGFSYKS